jgi:hypothetical protein
VESEATLRTLARFPAIYRPASLQTYLIIGIGHLNRSRFPGTSTPVMHAKQPDQLQSESADEWLEPVTVCLGILPLQSL